MYKLIQLYHLLLSSQRRAFKCACASTRDYCFHNTQYQTQYQKSAEISLVQLLISTIVEVTTAEQCERSLRDDLTSLWHHLCFSPLCYYFSLFLLTQIPGLMAESWPGLAGRPNSLQNPVSTQRHGTRAGCSAHGSTPDTHIHLEITN